MEFEQELDLAEGKQPARLEDEVQRLLQENQWTLSVLETITGGALATSLTQIKGASRFFNGGLVCPSEKSLVQFGVSPAYIHPQGLTQKACVQETLKCLARRHPATISCVVMGQLPMADSRSQLYNVVMGFKWMDRVSLKPQQFLGPLSKLRSDVVQSCLAFIRHYLLLHQETKVVA